jgi:hypothetical protein
MALVRLYEAKLLCCTRRLPRILKLNLAYENSVNTLHRNLRNYNTAFVHHVSKIHLKKKLYLDVEILAVHTRRPEHYLDKHVSI